MTSMACHCFYQWTTFIHHSSAEYTCLQLITKEYFKYMGCQTTEIKLFISDQSYSFESGIYLLHLLNTGNPILSGGLFDSLNQLQLVRQKGYRNLTVRSCSMYVYLELFLITLYYSYKKVTSKNAFLVCFDSECSCLLADLSLAYNLQTLLIVKLTKSTSSQYITLVNLLMWSKF